MKNINLKLFKTEANIPNTIGMLILGFVISFTVHWNGMTADQRVLDICGTYIGIIILSKLLNLFIIYKEKRNEI